MSKPSQRDRWWWRLVLVVWCATAGVASTASAAQQSIELRGGWNLIALAVEPADPALTSVLATFIGDGSLQAVWSYDTATDVWRGFAVPPFPAQVPPLTQMVSGRGYWVKLSGAQGVGPRTLLVQGSSTALPTAPAGVLPGWNLLGFPSDVPKRVDRVFSQVVVQQIWTFDVVTGQFRGVVFPAGGGVPTREDFVELEPGRGYWVQSSTGQSIAPLLGTALPPDTDVAPLLDPNALPDAQIPFLPQMSAGDIDIGGDGFFDRPPTQRAADFGEGVQVQTLSVFNSRGAGVLSYVATIDSAAAHPWIRFRTIDPVSGEDILSTTRSGAVATETDLLDLVVDRTGLPADDYEATVTLTSNGAEPPAAVRTFTIFMRVPSLDGDYEVRAEIDTINGRQADTANPRLFLSLYRDTVGLKGIIDSTRTLLVSQQMHLAGNIYEGGTNRFTVSGSFELPVGHENNPFDVAVRRDITLIGDRSEVGDALGPFDLKGQYRETIQNVLGDPIRMEGTFTARRVGPDPTAADMVTPSDGNAANIPDNGTPLEKTFVVTKNLLVTEVDLTLNFTHLRPSDLVVSLISPPGPAQTVRLRENSDAPAGRATYDESTPPVDSLTLFNGRLSAGTWKLRLVDTFPGQAGTFLSADLAIKGTEVFTLSGTVTGVPTGTTVIATGCGLTATTTTNAAGQYSFQNLISCLYRLTVQASGFVPTSIDVNVTGGDVTNANLTPGTGGPVFDPTGAIVQLPSDASYRFTSLTTAGGAGATQPVPEWIYAIDSATFDIDRPPLDVNAPGFADSNLFLGAYDCTTRSNVRGLDGTINGAAPPDIGCATSTPQHARAAVTVGLPIIGRSVGQSDQGTVRMYIGSVTANP